MMTSKGRRQFRSAMLLFLSGTVLLTTLLFGCSSIPNGNLAFFVEITGYTAVSGTEINLRLDHSTKERTLGRSEDLGTSDSGSVLFAGVD